MKPPTAVNTVATPTTIPTIAAVFKLLGGEDVSGVASELEAPDGVGTN